MDWVRVLRTVSEGMVPVCAASQSIHALPWRVAISSRGAITSAVRRARTQGIDVSQAHLRYLSPFQRNLGDVLKSFGKILLPEINMGQLALLLQGRFLREITSLNKLQGSPFNAGEIFDKIVEIAEAN